MTTPFEEDVYHVRLRRHPVLYASIGVLHTLLTAGIVFGWASLLPILRSEGINLSPGDFARVFTHGAIGNYLSSLPFGLLLDRFGPKACGITASILFSGGLMLCSMAETNSNFLDLGFAVVGFAGPAIQLPTLHMARLFPGEAREGGSGGAALFMSAQAGAFDGGTVVFAIFSAIFKVFHMSSKMFFRLYLVVPIFTLLTAIFVWPNDILPDPAPRKRRNSYVGVGSPFLSPGALSVTDTSSPLQDAPLSKILRNPAFYCLSFWVSVHILKLNFVVATINDQLDYAMPDDLDQANLLIGIFGAMLPFGFVVLPLVAYLLAKSTIRCFQLANAVGVLYGVVLTFFPEQSIYQVLIVFSSVATSRQLVYSTVFHQTGELFGFRNYGVLLGLTNVVVSLVSLSQGALVEWAEVVGDYTGPNLTLLAATLPLFVIVYWAVPPTTTKATRGPVPDFVPVSETSSLLVTRPRSMSQA